MTTKQKKAEADGGTRIKYMGGVHRRVIEKGDTIGGELPDGVPSTVVWDINNHHIADISDWSETQLTALTEYGSGKEFVDVTGQERVAPSLGQQMWRGARPHAKLDPTVDLPTVDTADVGPGAPSGASIEGNAGGGTPDPARSTT